MTYKPQSKTKMYKGYEVLHKADIEDNLDSMLIILNRARDEMIKPLMFHFVVGVTSPDDVPSKIVQAVKEKFTSEINKNHKVRKANGCRKRNSPKIELLYSIETKAKDSGELYNHIHIMFIVDAGISMTEYRQAIATKLQDKFYIDAWGKYLAEVGFKKNILLDA